MNQIACHRRQSIIVALSPVVLDSNVMAIDITGLPESFQKRRQGPRIILRGGSIEKSDDRHCRLLRVSHGRPSGGSANYSSNEIASSHCMPQGPKTAATMTSNKRLQQEFVIGETGFESQFYIMDVRFGPSTACTAVNHYSITSSARATSVGGTSRPRALAALLRSEAGVGRDRAQRRPPAHRHHLLVARRSWRL